MNTIFPKVRECIADGGYYTLSTPATVSINDEALLGAGELLTQLFHSILGGEAITAKCGGAITAKSGGAITAKCGEAITAECGADINISLSENSGMPTEGYTLTSSEKGVEITCRSLSGAVYGVSTLLQLIERRDGLSVPHCRVADEPMAELRGLHMYLPARSDIESFKRIVDVMALLKMNTLILEIGGGMQYDRHPEINRAWERFCHQLNEEFPGSGKYRALQGSDIYWKDSVHTELAGGSYLTKAEVADLADYCRRRGIEVIPEIQALSHAYYLCIAHPEIAEMKDDPFPDTYCPNDERSYELYFDVAEEVLELLKPATVSIGHDEIRVLGWCDKCKDKSGAELVGKEILRLHEFYKAHGVRISMWGESAQTFINYKGNPVGVKDCETTTKYGYHYHLPATCKSLDMLPDDILMIDWYHSLGQDSEECFDVRGMDVILGNFHGSQISEWQRRIAKSCFKGAEVSSWCVSDEYTFGRDGIFYEMAFSAYILWATDYTDADFRAVNDAAVAHAGYLRSVMRGSPSPLFSGRPSRKLYCGDEAKACSVLDLNNAYVPDAGVKRAVSTLGGKLYGTPVDTGGILLHPNTRAESLLFIHNTKKELSFSPSHLFRDKNDWALGAYAVCYEDGTVEIVGLYYGIEVGACGFRSERVRDPEAKGFELDISQPGLGVPVYYTHASQWTESLLYSTTPIYTDDLTAFAYEWRNPYPEKLITRIKPINVSKDMQNTVVLYGIAAL